jgi:DNA ligase (NAD+)
MFDLQKAKAHYKKAVVAYYNKQPIMTDAEFDALEARIKKVDPFWADLSKTGAPVVDKKSKIELPYFMPSLSKFYPEDKGLALRVDGRKTNAVMAKLDGSSVMLTYKNGQPVSLITRGNGTVGGDISFHIKNLYLPENSDGEKKQVFRCEAVMPRKVFEKKWASEFDNPRNMVNGLLNRKSYHPAFSDIDIVVLGQYGGFTIEEGLANADRLGLKTVETLIFKPKLEKLTALLDEFRSKSKYDMDGLVIAPDKWQMNYTDADKPKDIFAFKVNDQENAASVKVKQIIWQLSGRGRLIPKIEIEPTEMDGVVVTYCTAHNAQWMQDRKIGPGAVVKVLRSGGVIPKIVDVVKAGKFQPPKQAYVMQGVHFVVNSVSVSAESKQEMATRNLVKFVSELGIEFIASKTCANLAARNVDPVKLVQHWSAGLLLTTLQNQGGLGDKQAEKVAAEFDRVFDNKLSMKKLMVASQTFGVGIGERKLAMLETAGLSMSDLTANRFTQEDLLAVKGFSEKTVDLLTRDLPKWQRFYFQVQKYLDLNGNLPKEKKVIKGKLSGEKISFTGYRDKAHEDAVVAAGGEVISFSKKTSILIFKTGGKASAKVQAAKDNGIKVCEFSELGL